MPGIGDGKTIGRRIFLPPAPAVAVPTSATPIPSLSSAPTQGTLDLSNAAVDELAGLCNSYFDKAWGPSNALPLHPNEHREDPDARIARRWEQHTPGQARDNGRIRKAAVKRATPVVLAKLGRKCTLSRWTAATAEQRPRGWEISRRTTPQKACAGTCGIAIHWPKQNRRRPAQAILDQSRSARVAIAQSVSALATPRRSLGSAC